MQSDLPKTIFRKRCSKFTGIIAKTAAGTNLCGGWAPSYLATDRDRRFNIVPTYFELALDPPRHIACQGLVANSWLQMLVCKWRGDTIFGTPLGVSDLRYGAQ
jgi:hypothetical protein